MNLITYTHARLVATLTIFTFLPGILLAQKTPFAWPEGKRIAISLTFDDARGSQPTLGIPLLDAYGVKGTFYLVPAAARAHTEGWKKAVAMGHEIGNHTLNHPCSGNFDWSRSKAIESYTLDQMRKELMDANEEIYQLLGVRPEVFAYPCGQTYVGRGKNTQSYVPLVAELFQNGRTWQDEAPNTPDFCDMAQLTGVEMDGRDFAQILPLIEQAAQNGKWLVLAGHEMNEAGAQTTRLSMLKELLAYAKDPKNGVWIAPIGEVGKYVSSHRSVVGK
jgi:peptidoglycan-N-acetylglucosamine deacetylase